MEKEGFERYTPLPLRPIMCGLFGSGVSLIVRAPVRCPFALGVKVTEIVQVRPALKLPPQVLDDVAKSVAFRPVMVAPLIVTETAPLFVSVIAIGVPEVPTD